MGMVLPAMIVEMHRRGYKVLLLLPYPDSSVACSGYSNSGLYNIPICCHGNGCDFANSALCLHSEITQKKKEMGNKGEALFKDKSNLILNSGLKPLSSVG